MTIAIIGTRTEWEDESGNDTIIILRLETFQEDQRLRVYLNQADAIDLGDPFYERPLARYQFAEVIPKSWVPVQDKTEGMYFLVATLCDAQGQLNAIGRSDAFFLPGRLHLSTRVSARVYAPAIDYWEHYDAPQSMDREEE